MISYTGMNPDNTGLLTDAAQLWNSVRDILTTPLATRVMRRDYGSLVPDLIDAPKNDATRLQCMSAAVIALTLWEPRIAMTRININYEKDGAVRAELEGIITATMQAAGTSLILKEAGNANR
ncbi:phage baseplate assembly protein [Trabulsiella guamensis ATCC 49490]|uniref:Phage baseplate assembly protein n=2 Tax=Trabulsiella guamensis TaxID=158852 RepID=A0A084ZPS9_9ENTR|nr:phage baseplate assembly protein [Trabulsiella guamensis ATCC 49490]